MADYNNNIIIINIGEWYIGRLGPWLHAEPDQSHSPGPLCAVSTLLCRRSRRGDTHPHHTLCCLCHLLPAHLLRLQEGPSAAEWLPATLASPTPYPAHQPHRHNELASVHNYYYNNNNIFVALTTLQNDAKI